MVTALFEGPTRSASSSSLTSLLLRLVVPSFDGAVDVAEVEGEGDGGAGEGVVLRFGRGMLLKVSPMHRFANVDFVRKKRSNRKILVV